MATTLEVLFTPADFDALAGRDLSGTVCVVFDVLRATSSIVTALGNSAVAVIPVDDIPEALAVRERQPAVLLAGERNGLRIPASMTGGVAFDLGNSPREFTRDAVEGKTIVMTTTNGTRALRACAKAKLTLVASLLNLGATARLIRDDAPANLLLVCSGTFEQTAYEDVLGAGALCDALWPMYREGKVADSAHMARKLFQLEAADLLSALAQSRNGRRLLEQPALRDDVAYCAQRDIVDLVARLTPDGVVRRG